MAGLILPYNGLIKGGVSGWQFVGALTTKTTSSVDEVFLDPANAGAQTGDLIVGFGATDNDWSSVGGTASTSWTLVEEADSGDGSCDAAYGTYLGSGTVRFNKEEAGHVFGIAAFRPPATIGAPNVALGGNNNDPPSVTAFAGGLALGFIGQAARYFSGAYPTSVTPPSGFDLAFFDSYYRGSGLYSGEVSLIYQLGTAAGSLDPGAVVNAIPREDNMVVNATVAFPA